jgi:hypothetical protein
MLGLGSRSLRAVLFSETGIWPVKYRRVYLALKNLSYLLELDPKRPAWNALQQSLILARASEIPWINDLRIVLSRLYIPVELDISPGINVLTVELSMKAVKHSMEAWVDDEIHSSSRVRDLLVGRLEKDNDTGKLVKKSLDFRHYLRVKQPEHRKALTKIILSSHSRNAVDGKSGERKLFPVSGGFAGSATSTWKMPRTRCLCANTRISKQLEISSSRNSTLKYLVLWSNFPMHYNYFAACFLCGKLHPLAKLAYDVLKVFDSVPKLLVNEPTSEQERISGA